MFKKAVFCVSFFGALLSCFFALSGHAKADPLAAVDSLSFSDQIQPSLKRDLNSYLKESTTPLDSLEIALYDLNGDNLNEVIIRSKECAKLQKCLFQILAYKSESLIQIGEIPAKNIMIGGSSTYGVTDILAFDNKINDYNFNIYMWSPQQKMYIISD